MLGKHTMCTKRVTAICVWTCTHMQVHAPMHGHQVSCSLYWDRSCSDKQPTPGIPQSPPLREQWLRVCAWPGPAFSGRCWRFELRSSCLQCNHSYIEQFLQAPVISPCPIPHPRGVSHLRDSSSSKLCLLTKHRHSLLVEMSPVDKW